MLTLRRIFVGTLAGASAGALAGAALAWGPMAASFVAWPSVWRDCGPHLFIPLWMGAVIGFAAPLWKGSFSGVFLTLAAGMGAGLTATSAYEAAFGKAYVLPSGFASYAGIFPMLLLFCGGAAAAVWTFSVARLLD
ncbi:MAG: hypothetical protein WC969_03835 [Elusimicrobiota bacterium]|jgi:hypothetical protein